jgi:DNA-binding NtrC family response regulator
VQAQSTPGIGSRFEVWLPCVSAAEATPDEDAPDEDAPTTLLLGRGETVLVVDDDRERLLRDEEMLAALGYEPVGFTRVSDALAACGAIPRRFDALLVGHLVPAASALDLAAAVRELAPDLPILLATASVDDFGARALVAAGISEVVRRPLVSTEIAEALTRCLQPPEPRSAHYARNTIPRP